jgi:hypothetical protein
MPKGVEQNQLANSATGQNLSNQLTANAANVYGGLEPTLAARAAHPVGYTPGEKAAINTSAQQSAGGTNAGAVGGGGLYAARTRNAGAGQSAIGSASRAAGANLSRAATGTEVQSANLGQQNQRGALGGLEGVMGTEQSGGLNALGLSNQALSGADSSAANDPWMKLLMQGINSGGQVGAAALSGGG